MPNVRLHPSLDFVIGTKSQTLTCDIKRFVVKDILVPGTRHFPLRHVGDNVKKFFFHQTIPACCGSWRYNGYEIGKIVKDDQILSSFLNPILVKINFIWEMMRQQPFQDSPGLLITDGRPNVFYTPTGKSTDKYCTVGVFYKFKGWNIHAYNTLKGPDSRKWFEGSQIIMPATSF